jgi:hypothetical protein
MHGTFFDVLVNTTDIFLQEQIGIGSEATTLPCSHMYHKDCIFKWLDDHNTCPVNGFCRKRRFVSPCLPIGVSL